MTERSQIFEVVITGDPMIEYISNISKSKLDIPIEHPVCFPLKKSWKIQKKT